MSAIERWRRIQGLRASERPHLALPPPLPTIDACILRMDAPSISDTLANKSVGSMLASLQVKGATLAGDQVGQLPGPTATWGNGLATVPTDNTKFFRPGHWVIRFPWYLKATTPNLQLLAEFVPWNSGSQAFVKRPFIGGTGSAFSAPNLLFTAAALGQIRETAIEFEAFFPEPWGVLFSTPNVAWVAADSFLGHCAFQLHCPTDDMPEALGPFVPQP